MIFFGYIIFAFNLQLTSTGTFSELNGVYITRGFSSLRKLPYFTQISFAGFLYHTRRFSIYHPHQGRTQGGCTGCTCMPTPPLCIPPPGHVHSPPPSLKGCLREKMRQWATRKKCKFVSLNIIIWIRIVLMRIRIRIQLKILMRIWNQIQIRGGGGGGGGG